MLTKEIEIGVNLLIRHMKYKTSDEGYKCVKEEVAKIQRRLSYPKVDMSSPAVEILRTKNELDIELYEFATKLFTRQWTSTGMTSNA